MDLTSFESRSYPHPVGVGAIDKTRRTGTEYSPISSTSEDNGGKRSEKGKTSSILNIRARLLESVLNLTNG